MSNEIAKITEAATPDALDCTPMHERVMIGPGPTRAELGPSPVRKPPDLPWPY